MPAGRPSDYSAEMVEMICQRISDGESVREICRDENTPAISTVFKWLSEHEEFSEQYVRAKEVQVEAEMDEIIAIADNDDPAADVQRDKLRIDARKWKASKLKPKKYGDKVHNEITGADGGPVILWGQKPG